MGLATSLFALGDVIDPSLSYWTVLLSTGKHWSERSLVGSNIRGHKGVRKLDWALDIVSTGDIHRVTEISLQCPNGRKATLEILPDMAAFQFKSKSLNMLGDSTSGMEYQVIGRVTDKVTGTCECFIWDYHPLPEQEQLLAYSSTIYNFGGWRNTVTPIGALSLEVQGFRL